MAPALLLPRAALRAAGEPAAAQRDHRRGPHVSNGETLADLPAAAQHTISSAMGQDQAVYHAVSCAAGVTLANAANGFTAVVQSVPCRLPRARIPGACACRAELRSDDRATGNRPDLGQRQPRGLQLRGDRPVVRQRPRRIGAGL